MNYDKLNTQHLDEINNKHTTYGVVNILMVNMKKGNEL